MTPDERFQNWWQSLSARGLEDGRTWRWLPTDGIPVQIQIHSARAGFLAGLASRDAEIKAAKRCAEERLLALNEAARERMSAEARERGLSEELESVKSDRELFRKELESSARNRAVHF